MPRAIKAEQAGDPSVTVTLGEAEAELEGSAELVTPHKSKADLWEEAKAEMLRLMDVVKCSSHSINNPGTPNEQLEPAMANLEAHAAAIYREFGEHSLRGQEAHRLLNIARNVK